MRILKSLSVAILLVSLAACSQQAPTPKTVPANSTRTDFLKLIDRPRVPLAPNEDTLNINHELSESHFTSSSDAANRVPGFLIKLTQSKGRRPVVICLHGTGGTKSSMLTVMRELAAKGFIAVAIDGRYHGERTKAGKGSDEYQDAILRAFNGSGEHPFFFDTAYDVSRLIDYLETRDDIDPSRIGLFGISKGGIETYLTAAVEPRIAVAVSCIGLASFKWALDNNQWQPRTGTIPNAFAAAAKQAGVEKPDAAFVHQFYTRVAPGIDGKFDGPAMAPLIAPRPLLVINGELDARNPLPALKLSTDAAQAAYHAQNADDHFKVIIQPQTGHKVNPDSQSAALDWFIKWLNP